MPSYALKKNFFNDTATTEIYTTLLSSAASDVYKRQPLISVENVAQAAAGFLLELSFRGQSIHQLPGPKALSMDRIVNIIGDVIHRRGLKYESIDYEKAKDGLVGKGYSEDWAESWMSCFKYLNEDKDLFGDLEEKTLNNKTFKELAPSLAHRFKEFCK
mgnify:CR=1 FL=1